MSRMEISCRRFAVFGGMQTDAGAYAVCVQPGAPALQKRGTLALITEPVGSVALEADACRLAQRAVVEGYFSDHSLGLTGSLLNALDGANNALLQYGAGWAGNPSDGGSVAVKTRRVKVGMTALLVRADGTGVYLSQMAPTQAYILHAGLLSALPAPAGWDPAPGRTIVSLKRVLSGEQETEADDDLSATDLSNVVVPAASLGSAPGIVADLIYRRVAPGDKIVLVSSSLARCIERTWAEETFSYDADTIAEALSDLARERGLAEAHACILELGVSVSSGVDTDYTAPVSAKAPQQIALEGGTSAAPQDPQKVAATAGLLEVLRGPREWFARRKSEPEAVEPTPDLEHPAPIDIQHYQAAPDPSLWDAADNAEAAPPAEKEEDEYDLWSSYPTQLFVQSSPQVPPYQAKIENTTQSPDDIPFDEELQFDGWEDTPPALDDPKYGATHRMIFKPKVVEAVNEDDPFADMYGFDGANALDPSPAYASASANAPSPRALPTPKNKTTGFDARSTLSKVLAWGSQAFAAILPQRTANAGGSTTGKKMLLPVRLVILAALAVVAGILIVSLIGMRGSAETAVISSLLTEAQQLQTAASQPGMSEAERLEKLQLALNKANEAAAEDPQSVEAQRLVEKLSADLDAAQGVTRLASLKLLFDLDAIDNAGAPAVPAADPVAPTTADNDVIVQGNDVYILDRAQNRIYRCQVAAKACSAVLTKGDAVGGETMGAPIAITLRVGSPVVVDDRLVSYVFSADSGGWAAERLGGADGLQQPSSISSYDGNLYLLGSKPGQVLKYPSGQYANQPIDWITDAPTVQAMHEPAAMAIDGVIYIALADGTILAMQGGKLTSTFAPKGAPGSGPPNEIFTNTDTRDLYVLRSSDGSITRLNKEGQTLGTYKAPTSADITGFNSISVDEGRNKVYITSNRKVYEASLPGTGAKTTTTTTIQANPQTPAQPDQQAPLTTDKPAAKPTVIP